jgi:hypothetical protein
MGLPFLMGNLALFGAFVFCVLLRFEVQILRARALEQEGRAVAEGAYT